MCKVYTKIIGFGGDCKKPFRLLRDGTGRLGQPGCMEIEEFEGKKGRICTRVGDFGQFEGKTRRFCP